MRQREMRLRGVKTGELWVNQVGDCRSWAILVRNFSVEI